jgi:hypothetical protein
MMDDDDTETPTTQLLEEYSRIVVLSFCPESTRIVRGISSTSSNGEGHLETRSDISN